MYWGDDRDSRYSGARRGIGHQGHWGLLGGVGSHYGVSGGHQGCRECQGVLGASRDPRYSGARRGIRGIRENWGLLGGVWTVLGYQGGIRV